MSEIHDTIHKARAEHQAHIAGSFSNSHEILNEGVIQKAEEVTIEKAESEVDEAERLLFPDIDENPFNKAAEETEYDIEKSDIMYALESGRNAITMTKTGKELKAKARELLNKHEAKLATVEAQADALLAECGDAPTQEIPAWCTAGIKLDIPYRRYEWDECRFDTDEVRDGDVASSLSSSAKKDLKVNCPANAEEAVARQKYNEVIDKMANIYTDIKALEFVGELPDSKQFSLTPRQAVTFGFMG